MQGIIFKGIGGFYYVKTEDGKIYECKARGIFRKENDGVSIVDTERKVDLENSELLRYINSMQ